MMWASDTALISVYDEILKPMLISVFPVACVCPELVFEGLSKIIVPIKRGFRINPVSMTLRSATFLSRQAVTRSALTNCYLSRLPSVLLITIILFFIPPGWRRNLCLVNCVNRPKHLNRAASLRSSVCSHSHSLRHLLHVIHGPVTGLLIMLCTRQLRES